ncbi:MAG: hypothetical protein RJQ10_04435 [Haliea sp.]|uniref:hypothetical protein n=1 Tax=Haliea sp. TaxID=1932666 RepID=UPI0032EFCDEF
MAELRHPASQATGSAGGYTLSLPALLGMAIALTVLYTYPLQKMTVLTLPLVLLVLGWVIYQYLEPLRLLQRHAYLNALTRRESWVRRVFWQGFLLRLKLVVTALAAAAVALLYVATIRPEEWLMVLASVPLFAVMFALASALLRSQLVPQYHYPLALRWACRATIVLLVVGLALWQLYWLEVPATRDLDLTGVLRGGFERGAATTPIPLLGQALGVAHALDAGVWHLMQVTTTASGTSRWAYLAAWTAVLLWSALKVSAVWMVLLGATTLAGRRDTRPRQAAADSATLLAFALVVATTGIVYLAVTRIELGPSAAAVDPCRTLAGEEHARLVTAARQRLHAEEQGFNLAMSSMVEERIDAAYALAGQGVEDFLDWNFSLRGQYQQLAWVLGAGVTEVPLSERVGLQVDRQVHGLVAPALSVVGPGMATELEDRVHAAYAGQEAFVRDWLAGADCLALPPPETSLAGLAPIAWGGGGAAAGIVGRRVAAGLGAAVVSRVGMRRLLAGVAARTGAKAATAGQASGSGALCGPMAWACIPALVGTAWLATDLAVNEVDEALNRARMRAELLAAIEAEKNALKSELTRYYGQLAARIFSDIERRQGDVFNLYRDGGRVSI